MRVDIKTNGKPIKDRDIKALYLLKAALEMSTPRMVQANIDFALSSFKKKLNPSTMNKTSELRNLAFDAWVSKQDWTWHQNGYYYQLDYPSQWPAPRVKERYELEKEFNEEFNMQSQQAVSGDVEELANKLNPFTDKQGISGRAWRWGFKSGYAAASSPSSLQNNPLMQQICDLETEVIKLKEQLADKAGKGMRWVPVSQNPHEERYYHTKGDELSAYWHADKKRWDNGRVKITHWLDESPSSDSEGVDEWISVEDRLPDCGHYYNISYFNPTDKYKFIYVVTIFKGRYGWYWDNAEKENAEDGTLVVTHWRPLPKPPIKKQ